MVLQLTDYTAAQKSGGSGDQYQQLTFLRPKSMQQITNVAWNVNRAARTVCFHPATCCKKYASGHDILVSGAAYSRVPAEEDRPWWRVNDQIPHLTSTSAPA